MSKILILGDTHLGIKNFNIDYLKNNQLPFLLECIDYCKKNDIKDIIQLGDLFDHRTATNNIFLSEVQEFFKALDGINFHTLLGNHDISLLKSREYSLSEIIANIYDNISLYKEQELIKIDGSNLLFVPWLIKDEIINPNYITQADYIFGHFEINSFKILGNIKEQAGLDIKTFKYDNIKKVFSGHFHLKQKKMNIFYTGTPYQLTWGEYKNIPGAYVLDTKSNRIKFIENKLSKRHIKVKYNKDNITISGLNNDIITNNSDIDEYFNILKNNIVKVFVNIADDNLDEFLYKLHVNNIKYDFINNDLISNMLGDNYINDSINIISSDEYILSTFKNTPEYDIVNNIIKRYRDLERSE